MTSVILAILGKVITSRIFYAILSALIAFIASRYPTIGEVAYIIAAAVFGAGAIKAPADYAFQKRLKKQPEFVNPWAKIGK